MGLLRSAGAQVYRSDGGHFRDVGILERILPAVDRGDTTRSAVGFVWLVARFAMRKTAAKTNTRLHDLEQRIARIERSTPPESSTR